MVSARWNTCAFRSVSVWSVSGISPLPRGEKSLEQELRAMQTTTMSRPSLKVMKKKCIAEIEEVTQKGES